MTRGFALGLLVFAVLGCAKEPTTENTKIADPYASLSGEAKVDAIRKDPALMGGEKSSRISAAQKEAGLPVTGQ